MCPCCRNTKYVCDNCREGIREMLRWGYAETVVRRAYGWAATIVLGGPSLA
jgi:hypothetical protein